MLSTHRDGPADVYVVGTQESCPLMEWERMLQSQLGDKYVKVRAARGRGEAGTLQR